MPYILLIIGVLVGVFATYQFFINAEIRQVRAFLLTAFVIVFSLALFFLAVTGRLVAALALLIGVAPMVLGYIRERRKPKSGPSEDIIDIQPLEDDQDKPS